VRVRACVRAPAVHSHPSPAQVHARVAGRHEAEHAGTPRTLPIEHTCPRRQWSAGPGGTGLGKLAGRAESIECEDRARSGSVGSAASPEAGEGGSGRWDGSGAYGSRSLSNGTSRLRYLVISSVGCASHHRTPTSRRPVERRARSPTFKSPKCASCKRSWPSSARAVHEHARATRGQTFNHGIQPATATEEVAATDAQRRTHARSTFVVYYVAPHCGVHVALCSVLPSSLDWTARRASSKLWLALSFDWTARKAEAEICRSSLVPQPESTLIRLQAHSPRPGGSLRPTGTLTMIRSP
jgi:hypothetical protein